MTTKIDELKALMAAYDANSRSPARLIDLKSALFDNASAPITAVEALEELESHCYAGALEISENHPAIAQARAALAPFGEND